MATVLGLIAVLGVVWLVKSATTGGEKTGGSGPATTNSAAASDATDDTDDTDGGKTGSGKATEPGKTTGPGETTGNATGERDGDGDGSRTPGGGKTSEGGGGGGGGKRSVSVNGLRLDGGDDGDGCVMFRNEYYRTAARIESVSFTVTDGPAGPGNPKLRSDNAAHCSAQRPPCDGARLIKGKMCEAGTVLPSDAPYGDYMINAVAAFTFLCDNAKTDPCEHALEAGGPPPTPDNPVLIRASIAMPAEVFGEGPPDSPPPPEG